MSKTVKIAMIFKLLNIMLGAIIVVFGIITMFTIIDSQQSGKFFLVTASIFMVIMGLLNILVEFNITLVRNRFSFMNSMSGKGVYNIFMGCVFYSLLDFSSGPVVAWVCSSTLCVFGGIQIATQLFLKREYNDAYIREGLI